MSSSVRSHIAARWRAHLAILIGYAALSIAVSWPLAAHFATAITGSGPEALSDLWTVWHGVQAIAGRDAFFSTALLQFPAGTALPQSPGPLASVLALPFWPLGAVAGYNGGVLIGLALTGDTMYLLARALGCSTPASLFAGAVLLTAPVHLAGLRGDPGAVSVGLIPLAALAWCRALDDRRPMWWVAICAIVMLLALAQSPSQFVQAVVMAPIVVIFAFWRGRSRRLIARRTALAVLATTMTCGPLVIAINRAAANLTATDSGGDPAGPAPDLLQFVAPPTFSRMFGGPTRAALEHWGVTPEHATDVSVPAIAMLLAGAAIVTSGRRAAPWVVLAFVGAALSLGPTFAAFGAPRLSGAAMPYSWLAALPGLDLPDTPRRFMQVSLVGIAAVAAIGLDGIRRRQAGSANAVALIAGGLLLLEVWPGPWPSESLPPTPALYASLASDATAFGILDLPVRPTSDFSAPDFAARYQAYQIVHRKGIAAGFQSRSDSPHPVSPCVFAEDRAPNDVRVDGTPSRCEPAAIHQLAAAGYRFVVWHKPSAATPENRPGSWADADAQAFVTAAFGSRPATIDDGLIRAWTIPTGSAALPAQPVVELGPEWYPAEPEWRWAPSPATLTITAPRRQDAELAIAVPLLHDRATGAALGRESVLIVRSGSQSVSRSVTPGGVVRFPIALDAGAHTISISLGAGNFRPSDYGESDTRRLSFAIASIDLRTTPE